MNVYDFDGTIYDGDSTAEFYEFCLKCYPETRRALLRAAIGLFLYLCGFIDKKVFKERFFSFLRYVPNIDDAVAAFWSKHEQKIKSWYLKQKQSSVVIVSASPEFLLKPVCDRLGVKLIASRVDKKTGIFIGRNCHGEEKAMRLEMEIVSLDVTSFYSDSLADAPLAEKTDNAFIVRGDKIIPWKEYKPSLISRVKNIFFTQKFISYVFSGGVGTIVGIALSGIIAIWVDPTWAYICGYGISLFITYRLTSRLSFKSHPNSGGFGKFVISYIPNFCILYVMVVIFIRLLHWYHLVAYVLAALFGLPLTFVILKNVFAGKEEKEWM
jgi:HAD superfamily phosphoserine phosphatase-like hydrolase